MRDKLPKGGKWFDLLYRGRLIYNACWEDPRLDRQALELTSDDTVVVLTSAGCNALDYVLGGAGHVHAVDLNPSQNALLELKLAGIRRLPHDQFFSMFGRGRIAEYKPIYQELLRSDLSVPAQEFWDHHIHYFSPRGNRNSLYYHGTCGYFAALAKFYLHSIARVGDALLQLAEAGSLDGQKEIYERKVKRAMWTPISNGVMSNELVMAMLGVPPAQFQQIMDQYPGGLAKFCEHAVETICTRLPIADNYFWRVYFCGEYTPTCCPEYLKAENFARLKAGLWQHVSVHTASVNDFMHRHDGPISRFVLLDHMDWLAARAQSLLASEWQAIVDHAAPGTRILWRSAGMQCDFVNPLQVTVGGKKRTLQDLLCYHTQWAAELHQRDRVHTYGSFYIADLAV